MHLCDVNFNVDNRIVLSSLIKCLLLLIQRADHPKLSAGVVATFGK